MAEIDGILVMNFAQRSGRVVHFLVELHAQLPSVDFFHVCRPPARTASASPPLSSTVPNRCLKKLSGELRKSRVMRKCFVSRLILISRCCTQANDVRHESLQYLEAGRSVLTGRRSMTPPSAPVITVTCANATIPAASDLAFNLPGHRLTRTAVPAQVPVC